MRHWVLILVLMTILISGCINQSSIDIFKRGCSQLLITGCRDDLDDVKVNVGNESLTLREICQDKGMDDDECREECGCPKLTTIPIPTTTIQENTTSTTTTIDPCAEALDIVTIQCNGESNQFKVFISNKASDSVLYNFTTTAEIELESYTFTGVGPTETNPLAPGENFVLTYSCNDTICSDNDMVNKVKVTPKNCPEGEVEKEFFKEC